MTAPTFAPMLAETGRPAGSLEDWMVETKLDGWRTHVAVHPDLPGGIRVSTRSGRIITDNLPELGPLVDLGCPAVFDGELVAAAGRCRDFYRLGPNIARRTRTSALTFVAFDLLWLDGHTVTELPYEKRRALLVDLELPAPAVVVPTFDPQDLDDLLDACEHHGVEGVMLKRRGARYVAGQRSELWRKVKCPHWRAHAERRRLH